MISVQDTLYFVLIFGAIWITVFTCWFLWQLISVLKGLREVLNQVQSRIHSVEQAIHGFRSKFEDGGRHISSFSQTIKEHLKNFGRKQDDRDSQQD